MANDRMLQIGSFCASLYVIYLANETLAPEFSLPAAFWTSALIAALVILRADTLLFSFVIGLLTGASYALGEALGTSQYVSLIYLPQVLTLCVGSAWVLGIMRGTNRFSLPMRIHKWAHRLLLAGSFVWSTTAIQDINAKLVVDSRDITGFSYLTTSDLFAMFCIASLSRERIGKVEFFIFLVTGLLIVSLLGSRSSIVLLAAVSILIFHYRFSINSKLLSLIFAFPAALYLLGEHIDLTSNAFLRLQTLLNMSSDESVSIRLDFLSRADDRFFSNPICFLISCHAPEGEYVHNFISILEHFGAIGVCLFGFISLCASIKMRPFLKSNFFPLYIFAIASMLFTRTWMSPVFWIYVGMSLFILYNKPTMEPARQDISHYGKI